MQVSSWLYVQLLPVSNWGDYFNSISVIISSSLMMYSLTNLYPIRLFISWGLINTEGYWITVMLFLHLLQSTVIIYSSSFIIGYQLLFLIWYTASILQWQVQAHTQLNKNILVYLISQNMHHPVNHSDSHILAWYDFIELLVLCPHSNT